MFIHKNFTQDFLELLYQKLINKTHILSLLILKLISLLFILLKIIENKILIPIKIVNNNIKLKVN